MNDAKLLSHFYNFVVYRRVINIMVFTENIDTAFTRPKLIQIGYSEDELDILDKEWYGHVQRLNIEPYTKPYFSEAAKFLSKVIARKVNGRNAKIIFHLLGYETLTIENTRRYPLRASYKNVAFSVTYDLTSTVVIDGVGYRVPICTLIDMINVLKSVNAYP